MIRNMFKTIKVKPREETSQYTYKRQHIIIAYIKMWARLKCMDMPPTEVIKDLIISLKNVTHYQRGKWCY